MRYPPAFRFSRLSLISMLAFSVLLGPLSTTVAISEETSTPTNSSSTTPSAPTPSGVAQQHAANPSSGQDFTGDKIILRTTMGKFKSLREGKEEIAPGGTALRVNADNTVVGAGSNINTLYVQVLSTRCYKDTTDKTIKSKRLYVGPEKFRDCPSGDLVKEGETYEIPKGELDKYGFHRSGWTYGVLLVPYKYHRHDKSFNSATTIGPYLGYRQGWIGFDVSLVGSIGIASLPVSTTAADGSTSTATLQGFTAAVGFITGVSKNNNPLQVGLLIGRDWAGSNASTPYEHEGKTWYAVQIGYSFTK